MELATLTSHASEVLRLVVRLPVAATATPIYKNKTETTRHSKSLAQAETL